MDQRESPLQITAGADGWTPAVAANVSVKGGRANVRDLTVTPSQC